MQAIRFVSKLFDPVRIHALYATRRYYLGDTIEMAVQVVTRDRVEVIQAKAELLWRPKGVGAKAVLAELGGGPFVHSALAFGGRRLLAPGSEENFSVDLPITSEPPAGGSTDANWSTRVSLQLVDRRVFSLENKIDVYPHWLRADGQR